MSKFDPLLIFVAPIIIAVGALLKLVSGLAPLETNWLNINGVIHVSSNANYVISGFLAIITAFALNQFVQKSGVLGRISNLTMFVFVLLFFCIPDQANYMLAWPLVFLQILAFKWISEMYDQPSRATHLAFNASFVFGAMALVLENAGWLMLIVLQSQLLANSANARSLTIALIGFALPTYFYNGIAYIMDAELIWPAFIIGFDLLKGPFTKFDILGIVFLIFMAIMTFISLAVTATSITLRERRRWHLVVGYMVIAAWLIIHQGYDDSMFVALVPATIILTKVLLSVKNQKLANALLLLFLAFVLSINS